MEEIKLEGIVENIIYENKENSYVIFSLKNEQLKNILKKDTIICTGNIFNLFSGESVYIEGKIVIHPMYGIQIKVDLCQKIMPRTEEGIKAYLSSGIIKGIGEKIAERIVDKFGKDTFLVIEQEPEKLAEIRGITKQKAFEISEIFNEQREVREIILFFSKYNIDSNLAIKIHKVFKENTIKIIEMNPYKLADEVFGIGFKKSDEIAKKMNISHDSKFRIKSAIKYILNLTATQKGNVYLPERNLIIEANRLLDLEDDYIIGCISELNMERQICIEKVYNKYNFIENIIFLNYYYYAEAFVAKRLLQLSRNKSRYSKRYDKYIKKIEEEQNINLADKQKEAIKEVIKNGVTVITGGPGTGKTTIINSILNIFCKQELKVELCAPTGRAAKRMSEATGFEAKTIHRLLGITYLEQNRKVQIFQKNEEQPLDADIIIVDECSMIDILLMSSLLRALTLNTKLILVGDVDQLPSVGAGNVLRDIINSEVIKVVKLNEIFRQAKLSAIVTNAHKINNGEYPILNEVNKDFFFLKRENPEDLNNTILELITNRLPKFLNITDLKQIQVLTPMKKNEVGAISLNNLIQKEINPPSENKNEKEFRNILFREGDKVMQIKNNYNLSWEIIIDGEVKNVGVGIFNGDEGVIKKINSDDEIIVVFDDCKYVKYSYSMLEELTLSYAITIHKSQGSEYNAVIIPIYKGPPMLMTRNLLYTAITRAKKLVVLVGDENMIYKMVDNNSEIIRYTTLKDKIRLMEEFL